MHLRLVDHMVTPRVIPIRVHYKSAKRITAIREGKTTSHLEHRRNHRLVESGIVSVLTRRVP